MATPEQLVIQGNLVRYELPPDHPEQPERRLYVERPTWDWIEGSLCYEPETHWPKAPDEPLLPIEQVERLFNAFVSGAPMSYGDMHQLKPPRHGVWEFTTADVRIFGVFYRPKIFIAASGGMATEIKNLKQYNDHLRAVLHFIRGANFDPPPITHGSDLHAFL